jgi:parvulin-like peptidyl-prolyl isomerase
MKLYSRKRKSPIKILVIITLLAGFAFAVSKQFVAKKINDIVVAQIGDENIYKSDIEKKLKEVFANNQNNSQISFEKLPDQVLELFAREIFLDRKIIAEAKRLGLDNSTEIKDSIENFKTSTIRQAYVNNSLKDVVTDQRIVEKFNEMNAETENKNEYKYYQIVVKEQLQAENIYKELKASKKPLKFSDGARKYSVDTQSSGNGGEVDYKQESSIQKDVLDTLKNLKKDEISKPFQSGSDWYLVKFADIKKSKPIEFETTKEYIRHLIKIEEVEKINGKFVKDNKVKILLKRDANNDNKKPLEENKSLDNPVEQNKNIEQNKNEETVQQPAPESAPQQEGAKEPGQQPVESNQQKL